MNNTLVIYEYKAALYDVYHWIERFKDKIEDFSKKDWCSQAIPPIVIGTTFKVKMSFNDEEITIIPFNLLEHVNKDKSYYNKIVLIGRVPIENQEIMNLLKQLLF